MKFAQCQNPFCRHRKPINMLVYRESLVFCGAECFETWKKAHEVSDHVEISEPFRKRERIIRAALASSG